MFKPGPDEPESIWMWRDKRTDLFPGQVHAVSARSGVSREYMRAQRSDREICLGCLGLLTS